MMIRVFMPLSPRHQTRLLVILMALALVLLLPLFSSTVSTLPGTPGTVSSRPHLDTLPLSFEPNAGQSDPAVRYTVHSGNGTLLFTPSEVVLSLTGSSENGAASTGTRLNPRAQRPQDALHSKSIATLHLQFIDSNPNAAIEQGSSLPGKVNYLLGNDPAQWHTGLPTYSGVTYSGLYPGIDLAYSGADGQLKGTYTLAPGADPSAIRWRYAGADTPTIGQNGNLLITTLSALGLQSSLLTEAAPVAWQEAGGQRFAVSVRYVAQAGGNFGFSVGDYDPALPLTIDPTLTYSTYLGGFYSDGAGGIGLDGAGNIYVSGSTNSTDFPAAGDPFQPVYGGAEYDSFVSKISADGSTLIYSTFLGGDSWDTGGYLLVDSAGSATVAGSTYSENFPVTAGAYQTQLGGNDDGFVARLSNDGSDLVYSTFYGGCCTDELYGLGTDSAGNIYITGYTFSPDIPTVNPFQAGCADNCVDSDAFIAKLKSDGSQLLYGTFLGGFTNDPTDINEWGFGITADSTGNIYTVGTTRSPDFPVANAYQPIKSGFEDAFVTKIKPSVPAAQQLIYSTFLGGGGSDYAFGGVVVDAAGNAYVAGETSSGDFPVANPFQPIFGGSRDAFLTKFAPSGSAVDFSTFLGGEDDDSPWGIKLNAAGEIYLDGQTQSADFPTHNALQGTLNGTSDAFVTKFNASGATVAYSTFLGGSDDDGGGGLTLNTAGNAAYIAGWTGSTNFPVVNPVQGTQHGGGDAFVAIISDGAPPTATPTLTGTPPTATPTRTPACGSLTAWRTETPMPIPYSHSVAAVHDNQLYVIGGASNSPTPVPHMQRYDLATNTWATLPPNPNGVADNGAAAIGNKIYVMGSTYPPYEIFMQIYDISTNTWSRGATLPDQLGNGAFAQYGGKIYIFGGQFSLPSTHVYEYDPATDTFTAKAPMPSAQAEIGAAAVGNRIYVVGGYQYIHYAYDPAADSWTTMASPLTPTFSHPGVFALNGELWVEGGYDNYTRRPYPPSQEVQIYNPNTNSWHFGPAFNTPRYYSTAAGAINGRGYVVGGIDFYSNDYPYDYLSSMESIGYVQCGTGTPSPMPATPTHAFSTTATRTATRAVVVTGTAVASPTTESTPMATFTAIATDTALTISSATSTMPSSTAVSTRTITPTVTNTAATISTATNTVPPSTATSTATATACAITFSDVPEGSTFYAFIRCLACRGILGGYEDGTFRPGNDVTRGQLSKIVANAAGFGEPVSGQTFEDVAPADTFYPFVERMASRSIIGGYPCGDPGEPCGPGSKPYFRPNANATRGQISKIVSDAAGFLEPPGAQIFEDVAPGSTFYDFIQRLANHDVMSGYACGGPGEPCNSPGMRSYFRPGSLATRGQTAKIVANTFLPNCDTSAWR